MYFLKNDDIICLISFQSFLWVFVGFCKQNTLTGRTVGTALSGKATFLTTTFWQTLSQADRKTYPSQDSHHRPTHEKGFVLRSPSTETEKDMLFSIRSNLEDRNGARKCVCMCVSVLRQGKECWFRRSQPKHRCPSPSFLWVTDGDTMCSRGLSWQWD